MHVIMVYLQVGIFRKLIEYIIEISRKLIYNFLYLKIDLKRDISFKLKWNHI